MAKRKVVGPKPQPVTGSERSEAANRLVDMVKYDEARLRGAWHPAGARPLKKYWRTFMGSFPKSTMTPLGLEVLEWALETAREALRARGLTAGKTYRGANKAGFYIKWAVPNDDAVYALTLLADAIYDRFNVTARVERKTGRTYGEKSSEPLVGKNYLVIHLS